MIQGRRAEVARQTQVHRANQENPAPLDRPEVPVALAVPVEEAPAEVEEAAVNKAQRLTVLTANSSVAYAAMRRVTGKAARMLPNKSLGSASSGISDTYCPKPCSSANWRM